MNHRIVYEATPHPPRCIRLSLDLFEPYCRVLYWVSRSEMGDHVCETGVINSKQYRRIFILDESINVAVHLRYDAPVIEHAQRPHDRSALGDIMRNRQPCFGGRGARRSYELSKSDPRSDRLCSCDD